jgi:hypothetical protein
VTLPHAIAAAALAGMLVIFLDPSPTAAHRPLAALAYAVFALALLSATPRRGKTRQGVK